MKGIRGRLTGFRWRLVAPAAAVALAGAMLPGMAVHAASALSKPASSLRFDTPVVVDNIRPGFEPDVQVDTRPGAGVTYTSMPFGFSTTQSFLYRSDDGRRSFHMVEGNALGKLTTCAGGGDTELQTDPVSGALYFVDLQGLTNFSTASSSDRGATWTVSCDGVNGVGVDRQWVGIDSNGGTSAVGPGSSEGRLYLDYDNILQNTDPDQLLGNQLVMNESLDGVHYGGLCQVAGAACPAPPAVISADEGLPGNIVVDNVKGSPYQHSVYAIHTNGAGSAIIVSSCRGKPGDTTAAQVAADCTDPTQASVDPAHVNVNWHDSYARVPGTYSTGSDFGVIAIDRSSNLYAVWAEYPPTGPGAIKLSVSKDGATTWSAPIQVSPTTLGNNVMPWIVAGDAGRIAVAWYGAPQAVNADGGSGPDTLDNGTWNVYLAQSLNATATSPAFTVVKVSDHQVKFGNISTQGLGGSPDRSLGDFMQVSLGSKGEAVVAYVDDTSADRNPDFCLGCGQTPPEAAGPVMIATQGSGPSLFASVGNVPALKAAVGTVADGTGDAFLPAAGTDTMAPAALDVTGASVKQADASHLTVTLSTNDLNLAQDLAIPAGLGGPVGEWIVRWAAPTYHNGPGDGNIFYVGMESVAGGTPEFYTGTTGAITTTHAKYFVYPKTTPVPGHVSGSTITWTVPLLNIDNPSPGQGLFSITGFTATQLTESLTSMSSPNGGTFGDENIANAIDLTPPFTFVRTK